MSQPVSEGESLGILDQPGLYSGETEEQGKGEVERAGGGEEKEEKRNRGRRRRGAGKRRKSDDYYMSGFVMFYIINIT